MKDHNALFKKKQQNFHVFISLVRDETAVCVREREKDANTDWQRAAILTFSQPNLRFHFRSLRPCFFDQRFSTGSRLATPRVPSGRSP